MKIEIEITLKKIVLYSLLFLVVVITVAGVYEMGYDDGARDMLRISCGIDINSGGL